MLYIYILAMLFSTLVALILIGAVVRLRDAPDARALIAIMLLAAIWTAGYVLELVSPALTAKLFWVKVQYVGIAALPLAWLIFAFSYIESPSWVARNLAYGKLLAIIPGITLGLAWTNDRHGLIHARTWLFNVDSIRILGLEYGAWFWVFWVYSYLLIITGSLWLVRNLLRSNRLHRWQIGTALLGALFPWVGNLLYITRLNPLPYLDWTPLGFSIAGLLLAISLFRFHLLKVIPIAHKTVFEEMPDGVVILDPKGYIIDLNPAANRIIRLPSPTIVGRPLSQFIPNLGSDFQLQDNTHSLHTEVVLSKNSGQAIFDVHISPLTGRNLTILGHLVILHDITQSKAEQLQLQKARDELEVRVLRRTEELTKKNEQLRSELTQRRLAEKRFQEIVNSNPDAILLINSEGRIILANAQAGRIFGYYKDELCDQKLSTFIPELLRSRHQDQVIQFFNHPVGQQMGPEQIVYALRRDGSQFPTEVTISLLQMAEGILAACFIRDVSERMQAEVALKESEETYRALFEHANDSIFLTNIAGDQLQVNQKAADLLGYSQEALRAMSLLDILVPGEHLNGYEISAEFAHSQALPMVERHFRTFSGELLTVEITQSVVRDVQGKPKFLQYIVRDITGRKKAEQEQVLLLEEVQESREQLRALTFRLQEVQEIERRQIASELHDRVGQNLTGLNLNLQIIENQLGQEIGAAVRNRLVDSQNLVEQTTRQVRDVMADLQPPVLDEYGLVSALNWYSGIFTQRTGIATRVIGDEFEPRLARNDEMVLFRFAQEALNNVAKHSHAAHVEIIAESFGEAACLKVQDDGVGFDLHDLNARTKQLHWGLINMEQRAASIGAQLTIESSPGKGTQVSVVIRRPQNED